MWPGATFHTFAEFSFVNTRGILLSADALPTPTTDASEAKKPCRQPPADTDKLILSVAPTTPMSLPVRWQLATSPCLTHATDACALRHPLCAIQAKRQHVPNKPYTPEPEVPTQVPPKKAAPAEEDEVVETPAPASKKMGCGLHTTRGVFTSRDRRENAK